MCGAHRSVTFRMVRIREHLELRTRRALVLGSRYSCHLLVVVAVVLSPVGGTMKPLDGIRVLEFSTMITASFAAMMLAEQGAEVIKVEPLDAGDPMRYIGSSKGGVSALFAGCNRGKRSLRVDLKADRGRVVIEQLADRTDIVLTNYRPGVMDGLGLGQQQPPRPQPAPDLWRPSRVSAQRARK